MFKGIATVALLIISNAFMTLAWYGHIAFKSKLRQAAPVNAEGTPQF